MSNYFGGSEFRAIDSNAAADNEPLSAALEAHLANNQHYLHRIGGGSAMRLGAPSDATLTGDNAFSQASVGLSVMHLMPFLVTRGLSEVRIDWHGRIEDYDIDVRLALRGFGEVEATWEQSDGAGTNNELRSITLTLPTPAEYEYETDLILYQLGKPGELVGALTVGKVSDGVVEVKPDHSFTSTVARGIAATVPGGDGPEARTLFEPIARLIDTDHSEGGAGDAAILAGSTANGAGLRFSEIEIARVSMRSIQVTMRHA